MIPASHARSMTGFGRATKQDGQRLLELDLRSVNNKGFKLAVRAPDLFSPLLPKLESRVAEVLGRGSVNLSIKLTERRRAPMFDVDVEQLQRYRSSLGRLCEDLDEPTLSLPELLALPGVVSQQSSDPIDPEELWHFVAEPLELALDELIAMRIKEGRGLAEDVLQAIARIEASLLRVEALLPETLTAWRDKLSLRLSKLLEKQDLLPDPREIAQQLALFADRCDISEELQRLRSHCLAARDAIAAKEPTGRRLEFLAQEMQREANTMTSKSHGLVVIDELLTVKLEVERIREQTANFE